MIFGKITYMYNINGKKIRKKEIGKKNIKKHLFFTKLIILFLLFYTSKKKHASKKSDKILPNFINMY